MSKISLLRVSAAIVALSFFAIGCNQGDERLEEKARIEGRAQAQTELQAQVDNLDKKVEIAKAEGKAQAQAELQAQIENIELLTQKARAEGRAQADASINAQNGNLASKSSEMESVHFSMLSVAITCRNFKEAFWQVPRLLLAVPSSVFDLNPEGNTGRSNVGMFTKMKVPRDLQEILSLGTQSQSTFRKEG